MNRLIKRMLENRGLDIEKFREISNPYYDKLKDIDALAVRLKEIHDDEIPITIYPDFDMDGIASGDCFFAGLSELGFRVNLFIPNPSFGYGITAPCVDYVMKMYPETKVIITCDTGITAFNAADYCREIGVELIVTDHHTQEGIVNADIIVDPMRADEEYSHPRICGAFVVYQILQYYADLYGNLFQQDQIRRLRVFAGIGTVSDVMPLLYENRQVVLDAVNIMRFVYGDGGYDAVMSIPGSNAYRRAFFGLYNVAKVCESYGTIKSPDDITEEFFGFYFAPMFNSIKRMNGDMVRAFGVFFADSSNADMNYLYKLNAARKERERKEMQAILDRDQPFAPFIYFSDADSGVLGLLANKLMSKTGMPVFVFRDDGEGAVNRFHGSGRAPDWYPCITRLSSHLSSIAGHEGAFGASVDNIDMLTALVDFLHVDVPQAYSEADLIEAVPDFTITTDWTGDTGIDIELFDEFLHEIDQYRPFGNGFPAPSVLFTFTNNDVISWNQLSGGKHLKLLFHNGFEALCWNQGDMAAEKDKCDKHAIVGRLKYSEYKGVVSIVFDGVFQESKQI